MRKSAYESQGQKKGKAEKRTMNMKKSHFNASAVKVY